MPFEGETASYATLRRLMDNEKIKAFEENLKTKDLSAQSELVVQKCLNQGDLQSDSKQQPDLIIAIDGGRDEVSVLKGFPAANYGYIAVSSVLMDLKKICELEKEQFPSPVDVRKTQSAICIDAVFPGCNVFENENEEPKAFFRRKLYEELQNHRSFENGESVLETYEYLLQMRINDGSIKQKSPISGFEDDEITLQTGKFTCPHSNEPLYSTDALRIYENMKNDSSNLGIFTQIMSMLEKLWLVNILRSFERRGWLPTLRRVAFVVDGPLAVFDTAAWLSKYIGKEIERINLAQKEINKQDLIIIGLEKGGSFAEHFERLDMSQSGEKGRFPKGAVFLLDNDYIRKNIEISTGKQPYGKATYFGRKLFYKTLSGRRLVPIIASFNDYERDIYKAEIAQFSRLKDILQLLDKLISSRYPNSITPLIEAHAYAAIPQQMGQKLFEELAKKIRERDTNA